ncbi:MAG: RNA methyltransferase [Ignavibacteriales bacterium]|nr:RNA methyltransferase [Ignavibacteriales bacterium]
MIKHRNQLSGATDALRQIFEEGHLADLVVKNLFKANKKWGSRDRGAVAETIYEIVRWKRLLEYGLDREALDDAGRNLLVAARETLAGESLPEWEEYAEFDAGTFLARVEEGRKIRAVRESIPDWLDELGASELGERWEETIAALNRPADVVLRANRLKTDRDGLREALAKENVETRAIEFAPDAVVLEKRQNVFRTRAFREGLFEAQDAASQLVAPFAAPEPKQRVIDACAGAGGKTLHLAALMNNTGRIVALDVEEWKLKELKRRAKRAGVSNAETKPATTTKTAKRLRKSGDRVLIDSPCSGLGALRRNPDAKWKLTPAKIDNLRALQEELLNRYANMTRVGGFLTYATCSVLPSENERRFAAFLESRDDFELAEERTVSPVEGYDGFYMGKARRVS